MEKDNDELRVKIDNKCERVRNYISNYSYSYSFDLDKCFERFDKIYENIVNILDDKVYICKVCGCDSNCCSVNILTEKCEMCEKNIINYNKEPTEDLKKICKKCNQKKYVNHNNICNVCNYVLNA